MPSRVDEQQAGDSPPAEQALPPAEEKQSGAEQTAPASPAPSPVQVPDRYDLRRCKVHLSLTMLEDDGDPAGRRVILGLRTDEDDPSTRMVRATGPEALLATLLDLQAQLEADLPRRREAMLARLGKTQRAGLQKRGKPARSDERTQPETATPAETPATAPAPKPAATAKRPPRGHEESPYDQMTLFGD